jgi:hypothetical protein
MRSLAILAVCLVIVVLAKPRWHQLNGYTFDNFVRDFKKPYPQNEARYKLRKQIFEANLEHILELNADVTRSWKAGVNMFSDMSPQEFKRFNKFKKSSPRTLATRVHDKNTFGSDTPLPQTVDWRAANSPRVLTAVKHQGSCGSCWAHSAVESIESQYALVTGMLPVLSVAQINSCTPLDYGSAGCDGGDYVGGWEYLANKSINRPAVQHALTEEWAYPQPLQDWFFDTQPSNYSTSACFDISTEYQTPTTQWFAELTAAGVSGYGVINCNEASGGPIAQRAVRDIGPQSVSVAAGNWQWYETGVFQNTNSSGPDNEWGIDHAVQMVGYGFDKGYDMNYWVIRNSWSTLWGEDGFIRLWRASAGQGEPCSPMNYGPVCGTSGVLSDLAYPIVYEHTPTKFG